MDSSNKQIRNYYGWTVWTIKNSTGYDYKYLSFIIVENLSITVVLKHLSSSLKAEPDGPEKPPDVT